jgi:hypothetical protein
MRVLVGIAHDAVDGNLEAADLVGDVAVEILRGHHFDGTGGLGGAERGGEGKKQRERESSDGFHGPNPLWVIRRRLRRRQKCNIITFRS